MAAANQALRAGAELRIVASARSVLRTFKLTGLPLAIEVYPTIDRCAAWPARSHRAAAQASPASWCRLIFPATRSAAMSLSFLLVFWESAESRVNATSGE